MEVNGPFKMVFIDNEKCLLTMEVIIAHTSFSMVIRVDGPLVSKEKLEEGGKHFSLCSRLSGPGVHFWS